MKVLFALHDPPYGTERTYNGIRWARQMLTDGHDVRVFLFADSVVSVLAEQKTPDGYYNIATMLRQLGEHGGEIGICGTCLDARGIAPEMMIKQARRSSMAELGEWTAWANQTINI